MSNLPNIELVLKEQLCCGCGACAGICPVEAISLDVRNGYTPVLDEDRCTHCGLCYEVCPGKGYPVHIMSKKQQTEGVEFHPKYGPMIGHFSAKAANPEVAASGASGGVATALLLYLLEAEAVDCVVVPVLKEGIVNPIITDDPSVVLSAQGSKYAPVPMARVIADFRKKPRKFAMTCTPCQLAAWKMAEQKIPALKGCLVLSIGLFCGYVQRHEGVSCLARVMGVDFPEHAQFLGWRCGPYPGSTRFRKDTTEIVDKSYYMSSYILIPFFSLNRCFLCPDGGNWLADLVLGDIHGEGKDETVVLCRTKNGHERLFEAERERFVVSKKENQEFLTRSTINVINLAKMLPVLAVLDSFTKKGTMLPEFDFPNMFERYPEFHRFKKYWRLRYRLINWAQRSQIWRRIERYPRLLEYIGRLLYGFPKTVPGWRYNEYARAGFKKIFNRKKA